MSNLSAFPYIQEGAEARPSLWNDVYSILSANLAAVAEGPFTSASTQTLSFSTNIEVIGGGHFQQLSIGSTPPSVVTTAAVTIAVNSAFSDYLYLTDSSGARSNYVIGSRAGGTADGLNIWDASGATMIVSFSKQSVRFYQNVVGPVFDVGGALASTLNAATFGTGADSKESRIQAAILAAAAQSIARVYVPANMYPYSASSVSFIYTVQMVREGGNWQNWDVIAYGAAGDNVRDDTAACESAISSVPTGGGEVFFPPGRYKTTRSLYRPGNPSGPIRFRGAGITEIAEDGKAATTIAYTGTGAAIRVGTNDAGVTVPQGQGFHLADMKIDCAADAYGLKIDNVSGIVVSQVLFQGPGLAVLGSPIPSTKVGIYCNNVQTSDFDEVKAFQYNIGVELVTTCFDLTFKNCLIDFNDTDLKAGTTGNMSAVRFVGGAMQRPTNYCVDIVRGLGLSFFGTYFESHGSAGKRIFRIGATSGVTAEGISVIGSTMQGSGTPDTDWVMEVDRVQGLTVQDCQWDNFTNGFINNLGASASSVSNIVLINNRQLFNSRGVSTLISSFTGVRFAVSQTAGTIGLADTGIALTARTLSGSGQLAIDSSSGGASDGAQLVYQKGAATKWQVGHQVVGSAGQYEIYDAVAGRVALQIATGGQGAATYLGPFTSQVITGTGLTSRATNGSAQFVVDSTSGTASDGAQLAIQKGSANKWQVGYQVTASAGEFEIYDSVAGRTALTVATGATGTLTSTGTLLAPSLWATSGISVTGGVNIKAGVNRSCGTAVLGSNGSVNVANTYVATGDLIFLTDQTPGGTLGDLGMTGIRNASGFTIASTSVTDTSTVAWLIVRPT